MKLATFCLFLVATFCQGAEDIEAVFQTGMDALRAENNVAAVKAFAKALDLAEAAHDDAKAVEVNSLIYFVHKKFTLAQANVLHQTDEKVAVKAEAVVNKKVEPSDAEKWLERAQKFVATHKDEPLRCAATMFEIADRWPMTDSGRTAMKESLTWMAKVKSEPVKVVAATKITPSIKPAGKVADKVIIHNTHNSDYNDFGSTLLNVSFILRGKEVCQEKNVKIAWLPSKDSFCVVIPPPVFDTVKIEVVKWMKSGGGLSEVEIFLGDKNIALGAPVISSADLSQRWPSSALTDGITSSATREKGYWLLPNGTSGWVEVSMPKSR